MNATAQKEPSISEILTAMEKEEAKPVQPSDGLEIIPELRDLLDTLREESSEELEKLILAEGVRDPIVVWKEKNAILDGHNRTRIARKHNLPFQKVEKSFQTIAEAKDWMIQNQLGRRNLSPDRFEYLLGTLYNSKKQVADKVAGPIGKANVGGKRAPIAGPKTAQAIATQFGVSERTVRRAGDTAIGVDKLEQIRGKLAKHEQLSGKGSYTKPELAELAKTPSLTVGKKMLENLDAIKEKAKIEKVAAKQEQKAAEAAPETYPVVFVQPDFGNFNFNVANQIRPPLDAKNATLYMFVPDPFLATAMELLAKWGLTYEASIIFYGSTVDEGIYSKIAHNFMLVATRGTVMGPKAGTEVVSIQKVNGDMSVPMTKMIESYHPKVKKLDFRKGRTAPGFEAFKIGGK